MTTPRTSIGLGGILIWGAIVLAVVTGVLLLIGDAIELKTALALLAFAAAARWAASAPWGL